MLNRVTEAFRAEVASKQAGTTDGTADALWNGVLADLLAQDKAEEQARLAEIAKRESARQQALLETVTDEQRARIAARRANRKF